jgi:hypothetical protein
MLFEVMRYFRTAEIAQGRFVMATISPRTGEITSSPSIQPIGIATGIGVVTIGGMVFDFGFYPWWPYYWYPYNYYAYDYYGYPYGYDPSYYDPGVYQGEEYYDQNSYSDQSPDSTVAAAQQQLARRGYYRGEIDGIFGSETRRAVARYQSNHGLRVTGYLTIDTLQALGLPRVASN